MRLRHSFAVGVVALASCGALGYATAGLAASGSNAATPPPLSPDALAAIQANIEGAIKLELRAIKDLKGPKKRNTKTVTTTKALTDSRVAMRQAGTALATS